MTLLITCWTMRFRWTGSGSIGRIWAAARRGTSDLRACSRWRPPLLRLHAVLTAGLLTVADAGGVEGAANDLIAEARKVLDAAAANQDHGVLLQVVPLTGDVGADFHTVGQAHTGDLAQSRIRLLGRGRVDARAHAPTLRRGNLLLAALTGLQARSGKLLLRCGATLTDQLAGSRHADRSVAGANLDGWAACGPPPTGACAGRRGGACAAPSTSQRTRAIGIAARGA